MIVEEMNILNTVFLRGDNQKIYFPNSTLALRSIGNFYRSPDMADTIDFLIHVGTPADKLSLIKQRILKYEFTFYLRFCFLVLLVLRKRCKMGCSGDVPNGSKRIGAT